MASPRWASLCVPIFPTAFAHFVSLCHLFRLCHGWHICYSDLWHYCGHCLGAPWTAPLEGGELNKCWVFWQLHRLATSLSLAFSFSWGFALPTRTVLKLDQLITVASEGPRERKSGDVAHVITLRNGQPPAATPLISQQPLTSRPDPAPAKDWTPWKPSWWLAFFSSKLFFIVFFKDVMLLHT